MLKKPRAVLDTNILIAGSLSHKGSASSLIERWIEGDFQLVISPAILAEYYDVATRERIKRHFGPTKEKIKKFLNLLTQASLMTQDLYTVERLTTDPSDNKFLACALEGRADYVVSLDHHLLEIKHFHQIQIINLKDFLKILSVIQQ